MKKLLSMLLLFYSISFSSDYLSDISSGKWYSIEKDTLVKYFRLREDFFKYNYLENLSIIDTINNWYLISLSVGCGAGGYCGFTNLYTVNGDGNVRDSFEEFKEERGDLLFSSIKKGLYFKGGYLKVISKEEEYGGEMGDTTIFSTTQTSNWVIVNGYFKPRAIDYNYLLTTRFKELENKTIDELRLLRNEIFARNGYPFHNAELKQYFSKFDWYTEIPSLVISDEIFTNDELEMINKIKKLERKMK